MRRTLSTLVLSFTLSGPAASAAPAADQLPALTAPVNDFAHVIDAESAARLDQMIRALQAKTGDVVVVVTVPTVAPYSDANEYAVKLFENRGRGIGQKKEDNGLLILLALKERSDRIEVGYGLEQWITDGFAGETRREVMEPQFRNGRYGPGLVAGAERIIGRIAQGRNVTLDGVRTPRPLRREPGTPIPLWVVILIFIAILVVSRIGGGPGARRRYWGGPWSGWSGGVGPFGGGWGGGFGGGFGGGGGGGFGGFGGGGSGGGGSGGSW